MCSTELFVLILLQISILLSSEARPFFDCLFKNELSFQTKEPKFKIASIHYHKPVMQISENRSIVFHNTTDYAFAGRHHYYQVDWFTLCHSERTVRDLRVNDTFHVCQAGYPSRKLVYDKILRQVFVLEPESHHHVLEAVVYERHWSHVEHRFYLRPRGSKHKILSVAFSDVDPFSLGQEAMTTDLQVHSEVIRPHTLTEIWGAELMIQTYTD